MFNGFPTLADYERECARAGLATERRTFYKDGAPFTALITSAAGGVPSWHLFSADESDELLSGIVPDAAWMQRTGGTDRNFIGLLAQHGYFPDAAAADEDDAPEYCAVSDLGDGWQQLALFG